MIGTRILIRTSGIFEVQRELSSTMFGYVGSVAVVLPYSGRQTRPTGFSKRHTLRLRRRVAGLPWGAGVNYTPSTGRANYKALETKFQRRHTV